jgi:hypothetical protein
MVCFNQLVQHRHVPSLPYLIFNDVTMNTFPGGLRFLGRWSQFMDYISEPSYTNFREILSLQNTKIQNVFFTPEHGRKHQFVDNQG